MGSSKQKLLIGLVYAEWCGHCIETLPKWNKMQQNIKKRLADMPELEIEFKKISGGVPDSKQDEEVAEINNKYLGGNSNEKLKVDGYPTIFRIYGGKLEYYNSNDRSAEAMEKWYLNNDSTCGKPKSTGGKKRGNSTRRRRQPRKSKKTRSWFSW